MLRPVQMLSGAGAALVIAAVLQSPAWLPAAAATRASSVADITKQVLAGADVTLSGPSVVNLPDGTTTYSGVLSGHGTLTVAGRGTLIMTKDSDFTLPAALRHQVVTTSGGNWPYPIVTDPDQPAVIVDVGATLQYGNGGSSGIIGNYPYTQVSGLTLNQNNIEVNGTLNLDITDREFNLGTISGSGTLSQPRFTWGSPDLADELPFTGTISNGTGMNFGSAAFRLSMPDVARVRNDGSAIISARDYTLVLPQNFYQDVYGSDINFHTWQAGLIVMTGVDHYADPALDTAALAHAVNFRGINIEGANVQWGNGTTGQFFLPATPQDSYINIHKDGSLAFDYDRPVTLDTPISGGKYHQSLSTPAHAKITISPTVGNDVTFATPMNYHGTTSIGQGAELLLGTGSPGGDSSLLTGTVQDRIADDGALVIRNTATPIQLSGISGSGSLTQAGAAATTLGSAIAYRGATTVSKGTLALGPGASLASSSGVRLASAGAVLDLARAGGQSLRRLAGAKGSTVRLGSGTLTVTTSGAASYGGSITGTAGGGVINAGTGTFTVTGRVTTPSGTLKLQRGTLVLGPSATVRVGSLTEVRGAKLTVALDAAAHHGGSPVITANGAVRLSGKLALSLASCRAYPARVTLIHDSRARAIAGTFSGLRQSGAISVNGHKYLINYAAGGGHDVTLTAASARASAAGPAQSHGTRQSASGTLASVTKSARLLSGLPAVTAALGLLLATVGAVLLLLRLRGNRRRAVPGPPPLRRPAAEWDAAPPWAPGEPMNPAWRPPVNRPTRPPRPGH
ncbi:autotransporter [Trebonia kvetii]|uniref:Autotransporter n=1 Tax=Trebonia kvetii TaxID=2480626 RepID=A0A6P2C5J2_9ACTN|nr:autotransporter [Trebonia kvetii]TVZ06654.1 autotransporter [Trebonia kvetii]